MTVDQQQTLALNLRSMFDKIDRQEPIGEELVEITRLQGEIQSTAPPQLSHFLERRGTNCVPHGLVEPLSPCTVASSRSP